jgi:hemerythrin-like domain-containing protein
MTRTLPSAAVVDVLTAATAPADVLAAFDALLPGETLLLRTVDRPEEPLLALRAARAGTYEWTPLVEGPGHWEVEIHKRDARTGALRGVTEALGWDHDRLDTLERAAMEAWGAGETHAAARLHLRFVFGLLRHIRFEESVLFPEFERVSGMPADRGPTTVMRVEHRAIEQLLEDMRLAAVSGVRPGETTRADLHGVVHSHNVKEENVLYPMLDHSLEARETDALVFRFQAMDPPQ